MRRRRATPTVVVAVALLAASCSGSSPTADATGSADDGGSEATTTDPTPAEAATGPTGSEPTTTEPRSTTDEEPAAEDGIVIDTMMLVEPVDQEGWGFWLEPAAPGDQGPAVEKLQLRLGELGFGPGSPDGSYGRRTERAIQAFQGLIGLGRTGTADATTVAALMAYRYDGLILHPGDEGADVEALQQRLLDGPFDPGPIDGNYGTATVNAVWALEKLAGVPVDGSWGPLDEQAWQLLADGEIGQPVKRHDQRWVEVDLSEQLMKVYDPGSPTPVLISHASSGSGVPWANDTASGSSITPIGDFHIRRRISGWRESSLNIGRLYNPLYFTGGIALHGATSVPLYPASHGCIRLPMHIADYLPGELPNGTPVHVMT